MEKIKTTIRIGPINPKPTRYTLQLPNYPNLIVLEKGKFFWKGEEIEDVHEIYEKFVEFFKYHNF